MNRVNKISSLPTTSSLFDDVAFFDKKVKGQIEFINHCINSDKSLTTALKSAGKSYDDLIYINNHRPALRDNRYFTLEDFTEE